MLVGKTGSLKETSIIAVAAINSVGLTDRIGGTYLKYYSSPQQ